MGHQWLHLRRLFSPICIQFYGNWKFTCLLRDFRLLSRILEENFGSRKHIVLLDGFVSCGNNHSAISDMCHDWVNEDRVNRRLAVLCSMTIGGKVSSDEVRENNVERHYVYAWSLAEHLEAVRIREIYDQAVSFLDAHVSCHHTPSTDDIVISKYHFAGGSCRMMFSYSTREVASQLQESVRCASNIVDSLLGRVGDHSNQVVNRLYCSYVNEF